MAANVQVAVKAESLKKQTKKGATNGFIRSKF